MIDLLGDLGDPASVGLLLDLATREETSPRTRSDSRRWTLWGMSEDDSIATALLAAYSAAG